MKININIKDQGEQTFYLQPEAHQTEDNQQDFILVRCMSEIDNPLIKLKLMGRTFYPEIKLETDEPKEILEAKLDSLAVDVFDIDGIQLFIPVSFGYESRKRGQFRKPGNRRGFFSHNVPPS